MRVRVDELGDTGTDEPNTVVLVEGLSDQVALDTLAVRRGRSFIEEGIAVVHMGGATTIGRFLDEFGPNGRGVRLAGLCDVGEQAHFRRELQRFGVGAPVSRSAMERLGFFVCDADLEDELIRALGSDVVEQVVSAAGEQRSLRRFQMQPAQRTRTTPQQLRRFMGTKSGRKIRYARLLVEALDLDRVPPPLDRLLASL